MKTVSFFLVCVLPCLICMVLIGLQSKAQTVVIGGKKYEFTSAPATPAAELTNYVNQQNRRIRRFTINDFYIYPRLQSLPAGERISFKRIEEEYKIAGTRLEKFEQSLDKLNNFLENFGSRSEVFLYVGVDTPKRYRAGNTNVWRFGYSSSSQGINIHVTHSLGVNNKKTMVPFHPSINLRNIQSGSEVELGLYIASVEVGRITNHQHGAPSRLIAMEKLDSTIIVINEGVNFEIAVHVTDEGWFIEAVEN